MNVKDQELVDWALRLGNTAHPWLLFKCVSLFHIFLSVNAVCLFLTPFVEKIQLPPTIILPCHILNFRPRSHLFQDFFVSRLPHSFCFSLLLYLLLSLSVRLFAHFYDFVSLFVCSPSLSFSLCLSISFSVLLLNS